MAEFHLQGALQTSPSTSQEAGVWWVGPGETEQGGQKLCFPWGVRAGTASWFLSLPVSPSLNQGAGSFRPIPGSSLLGSCLDQVGKQVSQIGWASGERWTLSLSLSFHAPARSGVLALGVPEERGPGGQDPAFLPRLLVGFANRV